MEGEKDPSEEHAQKKPTSGTVGHISYWDTLQVLLLTVKAILTGYFHLVRLQDSDGNLARSDL